MIKKISDKKRQRIQNTGGESSLFRKIAINQNMICQLTRKYVSYVYPFCFAHILPKGTYPEYRMDSNNIIFVKTSTLHKWVDLQVAGRKHEFMELVKKGKAIEELQRIYDQEFRS